MYETGLLKTKTAEEWVTALQPKFGSSLTRDFFMYPECERFVSGITVTYKCDEYGQPDARATLNGCGILVKTMDKTKIIISLAEGAPQFIKKKIEENMVKSPDGTEYSLVMDENFGDFLKILNELGLCCGQTTLGGKDWWEKALYWQSTRSIPDLVEPLTEKQKEETKLSSRINPLWSRAKMEQYIIFQLEKDIADFGSGFKLELLSFLHALQRRNDGSTFTASFKRIVGSLTEKGKRNFYKRLRDDITEERMKIFRQDDSFNILIEELVKIADELRKSLLEDIPK